MKLKKKILSVLACALMAIGGVGTGKSFADSKSVNIKDGGLYKIESLLQSNKLLDMQHNYQSGNVHLWDDVAQENAQWYFKYNKDKNAYRIVNKQNTNLVLTWNSHKDDNVFVWTDHDAGDDSYWIVEDAGNGYVYLRNYADKYYALDVYKYNTSNGTNIRIFDFNREKCQKFKLREVENISGNKLVEEGYYRIQAYNKNDNGHSGIYVSNSYITHRDDTRSRLKLEYYPERGAYLIKEVRNNKNHLTQEGNVVNIMRWFYNGDNQFWVLVDTGRLTNSLMKCYAIRNKSTGEYLSREITMGNYESHNTHSFTFHVD